MSVSGVVANGVADAVAQIARFPVLLSVCGKQQNKAKVENTEKIMPCSESSLIGYHRHLWQIFMLL